MIPEINSWSCPCHSGGVTGYGPIGAAIMFVGIAPGKDEMRSGRPFTGQSGTLLRNILEALELNLDDYYTTNLMCKPKVEPELADIVECLPRLTKEIMTVRPKLIVALGALAAGIFAPDQKFGDARGSFDWHPSYKCWILVTNHPAAALHESEARTNLATDLVKDLQLIPEFLHDIPDLSVRDMIYCLVNTKKSAQELLNNLPTDRIIGIDIETSNPELEEVDAHTDELLCLAISYRRDDGFEPTWVLPREVLSDLEWPSVQWTWHYGTFDTQKLIKTLGRDLSIVHDTLLMHNCLEERSGRHRLKKLSRRYAYAGYYDDKIKGIKTNMRRAAPQELHLYCAHDTRNTVRLAYKFEPLIRQEGTDWLYKNLLIPAVNTFKYMQYRGVPISKDAALDLAREWLPLYGKKENALREMVRVAGGDPEINFASPQQLSKFLYKNLKLPRAPSKTSTATDKDILADLADLHPFVNGLIDVRHLKKMLDTYIFGVLDDIKDTGRIHPSPLLHGTNSGRCSYSNPPINTIPRPYMESPYGPHLRKLFAAEPGYCILEFDYKQAELYQAYYLSGDPNLGLDLASGDFHRQTAAFIHQCAPHEVTDEWRFQAKRTNFGKLYRIGDAKLAKQIKRPIDEAHEWSVAWDVRYQKYVQWGEDLFASLPEKGEIETVTHRKFRYPLVLDRSIISAIYNGPIQATSHDYILDSIIETFWPLYNNWRAEICLDIHDAIIVHCPLAHWEVAAQYMVQVMEKPRFGLPKMHAEVKMGDSWGSVKEIKLVV